MLHEIGVELGAALVTKGFPLKAIPIVDGPEPTRTTTYARERIVIEHDDGDSFGPTFSTHRNPKVGMTRNVAGKITIYAQSPSPGATQWEHTRRAEHILDLVLVALRGVMSVRKQGIVWKGGRFIRPADLERSETQGGAVYELTFAVERGVYAQTWAGAVRPEGTVGPGGITITGTDRITGPAHSTPETAC